MLLTCDRCGREVDETRQGVLRPLNLYLCADCTQNAKYPFAVCCGIGFYDLKPWEAHLKTRHNTSYHDN